MNKSTRDLKVWGGLTWGKRKQMRTIIATTTKKRAMELLDVSAYTFNLYWCETGNEIELETALAKPETIFIAENDYKYKFIEKEA